MIKGQGIFLCLLLLSLALAQTDFKNTCQNASLIDKLATGAIHLNPLDTYNSGANKDYYQDLSLNNFDTTDVLGYGFSLTGFQTSCSNSFYTLVVDKVAFENQNTRMRVVVDFRNPSDGTITTWNIVSFTYIVVSRTLNGAYSNIWATVAEIQGGVADNVPASIDLIGAAYRNAPGATCSAYTDPNINMGSGCDQTVAAVGDGVTGGEHIVHAYIMGFRYNPAQSSSSYLYAGVGMGASPVNPYMYESVLLGSISISYASPYGPSVTFLNPTGAIDYMKVAFVHSKFDYALTTAGGAGTYPSGSAMLYSSSYIFTSVSTFNSGVAIQRGTSASLTEFNQLYYHLPDTRYAIYGITSFNLPQNSNTSCSTILIDASLDNIDTYTITTPNINPTDFFFQADIFTVNIDALCQPTAASGDTLSSQVFTVGKKSYFTVPTQSQQQYILEEPTPIIANSFVFMYYGAQNTNNDTVLFKAELPFTGLTAGAPVKLEFGFFDNQASIGTNTSATMLDGTDYDIKLEVNGFVLYQETFTAGLAGSNAVGDIVRGLNIDSTTANVVITVSYVRSTIVDQSFYTYVRLFQYISAYDPTTGCCPASCPALTGLDVQNDPPVCIYCNTNAGLIYNPNNGTCTCKPTFYLDNTKTFQCYPCSALYCDVCSSADPTQCTTCVTGAVHNNVTLTCSCGNGFFVNGTVCQQCPYECQNCSSPTGACIACVDSVHRDINQGCGCITGFYDNGGANCSACSQTCLTCTVSTSCSACDATQFRNLTGSVCSCMDGYYELYHTNQTRTCEKCSPECLTCATSPALCSACDASKNRVAGVDQSGRQTCLCPAGYYSTADGSCVQSNCNADPFCSECEQGLKLCIKCLASKNRVIKLPESICICMAGYYADSNNTCVPCQTGCGICSSATNCSSCVALSTSNNDGSCACPSQTYFKVSTEGVRYCAACGPNCLSCVDVNTCTTCQSSYTKTADNSCVCGSRRFVDTNGDCLPCPNGCNECTSATNCVGCINPLFLQGNSCQVSCSNGYTPIGNVCQGCSTGCLKCTQNLICYYCADGYYMYNGNCYSVCPAGTIGDKSTGNWVCEPCNSPCKTCINHPSYCTSCLNGKGYLQTSAVAQSCVLSCVDGTYPSGGVCQVCDFRCATCLGSSTNCVACPANQVLYKGGCWGACPAISLQRVGQNASCTDNCPDGYYKVSVTECAACSIQCTTCEGSASTCTSCLHGSVSINGSCTVQCGENEFSFQGYCVACSASCYGCQYNPQNCLSCASGYVKTGSICQKGCLSHQFYETNLKKCITCSTECATCTSSTYCTTCQNSAISPRGGVCSSCPYPCSTCDGSGACTSCLSGFFYFQGACQTSCPYGASPINGICQCSSGIVSLGQCVTSCGSGFTAISGSCQPCNSNCAECSGDINYCTSCISGYSIDTTTQRCASQASCPYGQDVSSGVCTNICDNGFYFYEGICIYGGCFTGYTPSAYGGCVRNSQSSGLVCNSNQFIQSGSCVGSCSASFYPDTSSRKCLACDVNCINCFSSSFCIICATGFSMTSGKCVASTSCSSSQYEYNGGCLSACPIGTSSMGSTCFRSCPTSSYYLSQICYLSCPTSLRTAEACVSQCPSGTSNVNGNGICQ